MKSIYFLAIIIFLGISSHAAPPIGNPSTSSPAAVEKVAVNFTIHVEWKDSKRALSSLQIVTAEGNFNLDTLSGVVKINDADVPTTVKLQGTLTELNAEKGRLQLFLGRTIPYVTSTYAGTIGQKSSSYSQLSVGLQSTFIVTFGKPVIIQTDENGTVSILVKREDS